MRQPISEHFRLLLPSPGDNLALGRVAMELEIKSLCFISKLKSVYSDLACEPQCTLTFRLCSDFHMLFAGDPRNPTAASTVFPSVLLFDVIITKQTELLKPNILPAAIKLM